MSASHRPAWTREQFFAWAEAQNERYEFDGQRPVAMTGGNGLHNAVAQNLYAALRSRSRGSGCRAFGPDLGVETVDGAIRYPDAVVTCTKFPLDQRLAPNPVVVFEILSTSSGRMDRMVKLREYHAVASIRHYLIVESSLAGIFAFEKVAAQAWSATVLTAEDTLRLPEIGIEFPVEELYLEVEFADPS